LVIGIFTLGSYNIAAECFAELKVDSHDAIALGGLSASR
jgi:hypothetical protein